MDSRVAPPAAPARPPDGPDPATGTVTVRYFAGARAAAGTTEERVVLANATLDALTEVLLSRHGGRLAPVLAVASFLVDGITCHDRHRVLPPGATVDVLPPFAGG